MNTEAFAAATRAQLETHLQNVQDLSGTAFQGVSRLVDLNLSAAREAFKDSSELARQCLAAKDGRAVLDLITSQREPATQKAAAYSRHLATIAKETQDELVKTASKQAGEQQRDLQAYAQEIGKQVPAASQGLEWIKSLQPAGADYEQVSKQFVQFAQQSREAFEANLNKLFAQSFAQVQPSKKAAR